MLTKEKFETLISNPETSILDFKKELYDFSTESKQKSTASFIKDVISFSNTIREETAYIIFGIKDKGNNNCELHGIDEVIDDSIFQEKAKDKIYPRPNFIYYTIAHEEKTFGILEFPITKFEIPLCSRSNSSGLKINQVYYRNGTSNTEATVLEIIRISNWLNQIPSSNAKLTVSSKASELLSKVTERKINLSTIISELLFFAKNNKLQSVEDFCSAQIKGINENNGEHDYRLQTVLAYHIEIKYNYYNSYEITQESIKREIKELEGSFEIEKLFGESIVKLEELLEKFENTKITSMMIIPQNFKSSEGDRPFYLYYFEDDLKNVYARIRQKVSDIIMEIN